MKNCEAHVSASIIRMNMGICSEYIIVKNGRFWFWYWYVFQIIYLKGFTKRIVLIQEETGNVSNGSLSLQSVTFCLIFFHENFVWSFHWYLILKNQILSLSRYLYRQWLNQKECLDIRNQHLLTVINIGNTALPMIKHNTLLPCI